MPDTIAAIATAQIPSAIGILRLSGPDTKAILDRACPCPGTRRAPWCWAG